MIRVLYVGSGFCSCKGLAGELPEHLLNHHAGIKVDVVLPHADGIFEGASRLAERLVDCTAKVDGVDHHVKVLEGRTDSHVRVFYLDDEALRGGLSLDSDDGIRACAVYAKAVCAWLAQATAAYDVVHCDGLETALVPVIMRRLMNGNARVDACKSVVYCKGIENKGSIDMAWISSIGLPTDLATSEGMEFYGRLSILKGAYLYADALAFPNDLVKSRIENNRGRDIGMEGVLFNRTDRIHTIHIGSNFEKLSPATDKALEANYTAEDMAGKTRCKAALTKKLGLKKSAPMVVFAGPLDSESGIDLVNDILDDVMDRKVSLVIVGQGNQAYNDAVSGWKNEFKGSVAWISEKPACEDMRRLLSAADILLLPAKHESACRLHQLAMHYGCVVVARNCGVAAADIHPVRNLDKVGPEDNGFLFDNYDSDEFFDSVMDALDLINEPAWADIRKHAMEHKACICKTADDCVAIYQSLV